MNSFNGTAKYIRLVCMVAFLTVGVILPSCTEYSPVAMNKSETSLIQKNGDVAKWTVSPTPDNLVVARKKSETNSIQSFGSSSAYVYISGASQAGKFYALDAVYVIDGYDVTHTYLLTVSASASGGSGLGSSVYTSVYVSGPFGVIQSPFVFTQGQTVSGTFIIDDLTAGQQIGSSAFSYTF
jgi:hypothetical protein